MCFQLYKEATPEEHAVCNSIQFLLVLPSSSEGVSGHSPTAHAHYAFLYSCCIREYVGFTNLVCPYAQAAHIKLIFFVIQISQKCLLSSQLPLLWCCVVLSCVVLSKVSAVQCACGLLG